MRVSLARHSARKPVLVYATANMVRGGGDLLLLTYVRAMQPVSCRLALLSLEPIKEDTSMAADFREQGVEILNSAWVDWVLLPKLAPLIMPGVVFRAVLKSLALLRRRPRSSAQLGAIQEEFRARTLHLRHRSLVQLRLFVFRRRLSRYTQQHRPQAIHLFHAAACDALAGFLRAKPVPVFYTEITSPETYGGLVPDIAPLLPLVDIVVVPSAGVARLLQSRCRLAAEPRVIPFAVPIQPTAAATAFHPARQNYGSIGRLSPEKGHRDLLAAAVRIEACGPAAEGILAGTGPLAEELKAQAQALGLRRVRFLGPFPDISEVMAQLDVLVQPSHQEGMPLVLLEALACGKPIVATAVGAVPEMVTDGVNGFVVPVDAPDAIAARVCELLLDPGLRARMGRQGQEIYHRCYNYEVTLEKIRSLYRSVLAGTN